MTETNSQHLASQNNDDRDQRSIDDRPHFGPGTSDQAGPDEREEVIGQSDLPRRAAGAAGESAGSGVPGLGGAPGGTSNYGGVGLPGGAQQLGRGAAPTDDPRLGGTTATGGLGTGGQPASGLGGRVGTPEVLPSGATRAPGGTSDASATADETASHEYAVKHADQGALDPGRGAMINDRPGSAAANDVETHGDEAATLDRSAHGNLGPGAQPLPVPPIPAPAYGTDGGPALGGSLAEDAQADPAQHEQ